MGAPEGRKQNGRAVRRELGLGWHWEGISIFGINGLRKYLSCVLCRASISVCSWPACFSAASYSMLAFLGRYDCKFSLIGGCGLSHIVTLTVRIRQDFNQQCWH